MKVCYLLNLYPAISNSFIRKEILAMEGAGVEVVRVSIRPVAPDQLVEPEIRAEHVRTRVLLDIGVAGLCTHTIAAVARRPLRFLKALRQTIGTGWRSDRGLLRHFAYLMEACVLAKWTRDNAVQQVHAHFGNNTAMVAMLCRELGGPEYSLTIHGPDEFDRPELLSLSAKIVRSRFIVAVSEYTRSQLFRWCAVDQWRKISVVHCGLDDSLLASPVQPVPAAKRLVSVGRLSEQKGQALLVQAVQLLVQQGIELELVLVGDGPLRSQLQLLAETLGVSRYIRFAGWQSIEQVREHLVNSRAMVLPSFAEGLPVVIMEAYAMWRPVISTYVGGIPELVRPGLGGWLIPAGSLEALTQAMREALELSGEHLLEMAGVGRALVVERHNARLEAQKLVGLFKASIASQGGDIGTDTVGANHGVSVSPIGGDA